MLEANVKVWHHRDRETLRRRTRALSPTISRQVARIRLQETLTRLSSAVRRAIYECQNSETCVARRVRPARAGRNCSP